jgi:fructosamine-3-kinase
MKNQIYQIIENELNSKVNFVRSVGGGCINDAEIICDDKGNSFFLKKNLSSPLDMFFKEANGLNELRKADVIRVPKPILVNENFLLMEYIRSSQKSKYFDENFGRSFAFLHKYTSEYFGFFEDNYIGSTPQKNIATDNEKNVWAKFYFNNRIMFQFRLLEKAGYSDAKMRKLLVILKTISTKFYLVVRIFHHYCMATYGQEIR